MNSSRSSVAASLKLGRLALIGAGAALLAAACTIGTVDDNEPGNGTPNTGGKGAAGDTGTGGSTGGTASGGSDTGGSDTGGSDTGGSSSGGQGSGGDIEVDCSADGSSESTPASAEVSLDDDACTECAKQACAAEFSACFATDPHAACGYDGEGDTSGGEFACLLGCFDALHDEGLFVGGQEDIDDCKAECGLAECSGSGITNVAEDLATCLLGISSSDTGCQFACEYKCIGDVGCKAHNDDQAACEADTENNCFWTEPS